ncbi:hypothetical protein ACIHEJ_37920 [Streptomyces sp. NPDC052301]|uniref:hypothetical protein n=1 Tax=Streptomyces sp. NPDC052301 TaxID=3365687 RepID=UPI0037D44FAD
MTYERATAVPACSSTSTATLVTTMLGSRCAVGVDDQSVLEHLLDRGAPAHRLATACEGGFGEQDAESREVTVVRRLGVPCDQVLDGPVARCRIGRHAVEVDMVSSKRDGRS